MNAIAIFDIGKTNKKLFLFDEQYKIVWERSFLIRECLDEDGDPCEDLHMLTAWVKDALLELGSEPGDLRIRALNFSAYGASLVHIGEDNRPVTSLYNYLKPYPDTLKRKFYDKYGGEVTFSMLTASPVLGSLNSGMQLYRIKEERPHTFERIRHSLHLPQYVSWLWTGQACSDITSIGCHTNLWNFSQHHYHEWVYREGIMDKLAPLVPSTNGYPLKWPAGQPLPHGMAEDCVAGVGLHDSSAAMIPYLASFREPFALISTGTWCISMNPFNETPLTVAELQKDCLCYLTWQGKPVKSARLFAGYQHEQQVRRLGDHFHRSPDQYTSVAFDPDLADPVQARIPTGSAPFSAVDLSAFGSYEQAYHALLLDIMEQQVASTTLILHGTDIKRIFVDGGFGKNQVYMHLLAAAFPHIEVFAASIPQASAIGAAMAIHGQWNEGGLPGDLIELRYYRNYLNSNL
ncbi:MAG: FGGY family carbohydrate kinase [Bacteroidota bacterium]|nr:FGGY family carbohydrate kinase [Bacteroidota bacterium]MDP4214568.1 FGGY family carbohydrate kinase [Bacteroidota bacterium]MDP4245631.1 FGGY family carbohydrate kinase [Bacteroidota bacterium]